MKQIISILLILTLLFSFLAVNVSAAQSDATVPVLLNRKMLSFDVPPFVSDGRVIVPLRTISEALSADVSWNNDTQTAIIIQGEKVVSFTIGEKNMVINNEEYEIDAEATIVNSTTFVPLRALSESLGFDVMWDSDTSSVLISSFPVVNGYMIPRTYYVASGSFEGCVLACKTMVLSNYFDKEYTYEEVLELNGGGVYTNWGPEFCENLSWNIVMSSELTLKEESGDWTASKYTIPEKLNMIYEALEDSTGIIAQFNKDGKPHGIVITGYTSDNELIVCDPNTKSETPENTLIGDSCIAGMYDLYSTKELLPYLVSLRMLEK